MEQRKMKEQKLAELKASLLCVEGRPTEVYSRIVGYYRSVRNWNAGKREEFRFRKEYAFPAWNAQAQSAVSRMEAARQAASAAPAGERADKAPVGPAGKASGYLLFVRRACPNCPPVKDYLSSSNLAGALADTDTEAGLDLARQYEVLATPTAILLDDNGNELTRCYTKAQLMAELAPVAREAALA